MFRRLLKNKKAQNTAEYAILISLVVAGIVAMQTYAQRALQARVKGAAKYLSDQTNELGNTLQYEPYYLKSDYTTNSSDNETKLLDNDTISTQADSRTTRIGNETTSFNETSDQYK